MVNLTDETPTLSKEYIRQCFDKIEAKDLSAVMALFNPDAEFIDPHYPNVHMKGEKEIEDGLKWGLKSLKKLGFTITNYYESEDGASVAVEVATAHELPNGKKLNFPQVFINEVKNGKISRMQAYEPYGPHGVNNIVLMVTRLIRKFSRSSD